MISLQDVFEAIIREFHVLKPEYKHYFGDVPENFKRPSFLHLLVFNNNTRANFFTVSTRLEVQIIGFVPVNSMGIGRLKDELALIEALKPFLAQGRLQVKDRSLTFSYEISKADKALSIMMNFEYLTEAVNPKFDEEQLRDYIEHIYVNKELM